MAEGITLTEYEKAESELRAADSRKGFFIHTTLYILTNILLIMVNVVFDPTSLWFVVPLVVWGIVLVAHYYFAFRWMQSENEEWIARVESRANEIHRGQAA